jgi:NAD(P)-dependent dehydrogenase (short-subunit alcohol dehydrogenase family)
VEASGGLEHAGNRAPLKRTGLPSDIAGTALFLASKAGAFVTGATIALDGGEICVPNAGL